MNNYNAKTFAERLDQMGADPQRSTGPWWSARCIHPEHTDDTPSMAFRDGDGALLVTCHGCSPTKGSKPGWLKIVMAAAETGDRLPPAEPSKRASRGNHSHGQRITEYPYRGTDGRTLAWKVRFLPKTFIWERPFGSGGRLSGLGTGSRIKAMPLYMLPELLALPQGATVYVTEGEKDAEAVAAAGCAATCSAAGSQGPPDNISALAGMHVRLLVDNDEPGHKSAARWGDALAGTAASVTYWAGCVRGKGSDISDHLAAGHGMDAILPVHRDGDRMTVVTGYDGSPGGEPDELGHCLELVQEFITRFLILPDEHAAVAVTLWVAHCHTIDAWESTPRLALMSPEKRCGKTRVQEVASCIVPNPMRTSDVTPPVLFRSIAEEPRPTVFIDEVDTIWTGKGINEELRALVNSGHRRGVDSRRMVGDGARMAVATFRTFAAVCLAGIGELPDTIADRSIIVQMRRRRSDEEVERWRTRIHEPQGHKIRDKIKYSIQKWTTELTTAYPELPDQVEDRAGDVWEPLLAVADAAGGHWPAAARAACLSITSGIDEPLSTGVRLLTDIREVWPTSTGRVATPELLHLLHVIEDGPWGQSDSRPALTGRRLAYLLKPYGVKPHRDAQWRGYEFGSFTDVWARYCPPPRQPDPVPLPVTRHEPSQPSSAVPCRCGHPNGMERHTCRDSAA